MTACPVCGREFREDLTLCPFDGEPLVTPVAVSSAGEADDPDTVVRPRRAQPLESPRFTEVQIGTPVASSSSDVVKPTHVPDRVYRERPMWPIVTVISVVAVVALALVGYLALSRQSDLATEVGRQLSEARIAIADARARLESLPTDSPLRQKLLQLQQWDRELQNFELETDRTREMASRAREIETMARSIGEEARVAGASIPVTPPQVPPAAPPTTAEPVAPASSEIDPMAPKPADPAAASDTTEPKPGTEPAKPGSPGPTEPPVGAPVKPAETDPAKTKPTEPAPGTTPTKPESLPPAPATPPSKPV